jgi:hypothetical protein
LCLPIDYLDKDEGRLNKPVKFGFLKEETPAARKKLTRQARRQGRWGFPELG